MTDAAPLALVGIIGSLRAASWSRVVFNAVADLAGPVSLTEAPLTDVPLFNQDIEDQGDPPSVAALKEAVANADGLIIFTPEYNYSLPAVTKNAIDWLSRVPGASTIAGVAVGAVAATPGRHDADGVRGQLEHVLDVVRADLHRPLHAVPSMRHRATDGVLTDADARRDLSGWLDGFVGFVRDHRSQGAT